MYKGNKNLTATGFPLKDVKPNFSNRVDPNDDINGGINGRYASNSEERKNPNSQTQGSMLFIQSHLLLLLLVTLSELPLQGSSKKVPRKCCNTLFPLIPSSNPKMNSTKFILLENIQTMG